MQAIGPVALLAGDYDEAIEYFTRALGFRVVEDTAFDGDKRWVLVAPPNSAGTSPLLTRAVTADQRARVGDQAGGRVFHFLLTDDFAADFSAMKGRGVRFLEAPRREEYGTVAVFKDLYGNRWDRLQLRRGAGRPAPAPAGSGAVGRTQR